MPSDAPQTIEYATPSREDKTPWNPLLLVAMIVIGMFFIFGVLLPSLLSQRRGSSRVPCASNVKQIGQAFFLYSNENRNFYPPDLTTLLATQDLVPAVFVCPSSDSERASTAFSTDPAARAAKNLDYIYVGEGLTGSVNPEEPVLFERLSDHDHDGGNVLFGDGHVEFYSKSQILKLLEPLRGTPRLTQEEYDAITAK